MLQHYIPPLLLGRHHEANQHEGCLVTVAVLVKQQHIAAEMLGVREDQSSKRGLLAISLADNTALLTAIGNDLGYQVRRQLWAVATIKHHSSQPGLARLQIHR